MDKAHWLVLSGEVTDGEGPFFYGFRPQGATVECVMERRGLDYETHTDVMSLKSARILYRALLRDGATVTTAPSEEDAYVTSMHAAAAYHDAYALAKAGGRRERL